MLYEILRHIRNFFPGKSESRSFVIENGAVSLSFVEADQYFLIEGSKFNDGVYLYPASTLKNETFTGTITALNIPKEFISLANEIKAWTENNAPSAFTSESFGGYSYSKASGANGAPIGWKEVFASRLNTWRKL